jgi:alanine racemase
MKQMAVEYGFENLQTHISATSGLMAYEAKAACNTIVRTGIGAYGLWPSDDLRRVYGKKIELLPVLTWKTHVAQVKTLQKGMTVGYGLTFIAPKKMTAALIPQGYSDGFPRSLSNKGVVLIGEKKCPVLGRVAMNMCVVDVSRVPLVKEADGVVLLGKQGSQAISAELLGELSGTINYEAVTRISPLLPRILI